MADGARVGEGESSQSATSGEAQQGESGSGLKHCFGCQRIGQGFNKSDLKEIFGHRDMRSVDRYAKYQLGRVGEIMRGKICANLVQKENEVSNYAK
jgi:hypothetical protein